MDGQREYYESKPPEYYRAIRTDIVPLLPAFAERIVEIGCGEGRTLEFLRATGRGKWVCGIDLPGPARVAERRVDDLHLVDIERGEVPIPERSVDLVLMLDVLEHLVDPWATLSRVVRWIKPGGALIASVPNIRHYSVLLPLLLLGRWEYQPSGLLDRTHLRFFTRDSAHALLHGAGLSVDKTVVQFNLKKRIVSGLSFGLLRPFLEFQFLMRGVVVGAPE